MKITCLGSGAATAFPLPFCRCAVCTAARVQKGKNLRRRSSLAVNGEVLIDLSPDAIAAAWAYGLDPAAFILLLQTHAHADHFDPGHFVTRHWEYAPEGKRRLTVAATQSTLEQINRKAGLEHSTADLFSEEGQDALSIRTQPLVPGETVALSGYEVTAIAVEHDDGAAVYRLGLDGRYLLYATDVASIPEASWTVLAERRLDAVFLDHTYGGTADAGGHLTEAGFAAVIQRMRALGIVDAETRVYATHLSHEGNALHDEMEQKAAKNGWHIAFDGMEIEI